MAADHTIERHARNLEAAAVQLRRIGTGGASQEEQTRLDLRAVIGVLAKTSETERWARRLVQDALDEMSDLDAADAAEGRGGRR